MDLTSQYESAPYFVPYGIHDDPAPVSASTAATSQYFWDMGVWPSATQFDGSIITSSPFISFRTAGGCSARSVDGCLHQADINVPQKFQHRPPPKGSQTYGIPYSYDARANPTTVFRGAEMGLPLCQSYQDIIREIRAAGGIHHGIDRISTDGRKRKSQVSKSSGHIHSPRVVVTMKHSRQPRCPRIDGSRQIYGWTRLERERRAKHEVLALARQELRAMEDRFTRIVKQQMAAIEKSNIVSRLAVAE